MKKRTLYANVILANGFIVGWKTSSNNWKSVDDAIESSQIQRDLIVQVSKIEVRSLALDVKTDKENDYFFSRLAPEFYSEFPIHEKFTGNTPYEKEKKKVKSPTKADLIKEVKELEKANENLLSAIDGE